MKPSNRLSDIPWEMCLLDKNNFLDESLLIDSKLKAKVMPIPFIKPYPKKWGVTLDHLINSFSLFKRFYSSSFLFLKPFDGPSHQ
jgi:hypothetical protein